ncbi:uncharacterized protein BT62DRAFT_687001 [Guyanagaster necrorhizus]|uniref:Uncharacterized protein n=1 Tax=Guyanagaster necrorhizus TaxID=856835 RepID=A0A9P7VFZ8_9AGAR|nr:uncharacterized protein BT62DRAFT_687001 [Guyanagaster necrorhizus MCA 3950]KAG7439855.1 hypothetical protein BT62DRAFT_687001 [Guyanagaster necrorhizus MCA 3950]
MARLMTRDPDGLQQRTIMRRSPSRDNGPRRATFPSNRRRFEPLLLGSALLTGFSNITNRTDYGAPSPTFDSLLSINTR